MSEHRTIEQRVCPCCTMYGPLPVIDGTCRSCGHHHPGRNCEEFKAEQDAFLRKVAEAFKLTMDTI